jgi:hypothetical protein
MTLDMEFKYQINYRLLIFQNFASNELLMICVKSRR